VAPFTHRAWGITRVLHLLEPCWKNIKKVDGTLLLTFDMNAVRIAFV
jgi:hypothetical protein